MPPVSGLPGDPSHPSFEWAEHGQPCFLNLNGTSAHCERVVPPSCSDCSDVVTVIPDQLGLVNPTNTCSTMRW
eukprot:372196-Prymnesium_polylepis.1